MPAKIIFENFLDGNGLVTMLEAVELPARVADLTARLPDVDRDAPEKKQLDMRLI